MAHIQDEIPLVKDSNESIPIDLSNAIARMMSKDATARPTTGELREIFLNVQAQFASSMSSDETID